MDKITIAVPCYNEEPALGLFYEAVSAVAAEMVPRLCIAREKRINPMATTKRMARYTQTGF